jgi:hypothetical protein
MYILYLDDAGSVGNNNEQYFVLGGIALFERHVFHLEAALNDLATGTCLPEPMTLEFHGNAIRAGRGVWRAQPDRDRRVAWITQALAATAALRGRWALFGAAVNKAAVSPRDPVEVAFEQVVSRFDQFLNRQRVSGQSQRGLIVLDRSTRETRLQDLATTFRREGHQWGLLRNVVDVPFFVDSRATRAIQYADLVTYAIWRKFEHGDSSLFDPLRSGFDQVGGTVHGLFHERFAGPRCDCPYCESRRRAAGGDL